jgi:hypothetical protein
MNQMADVWLHPQFKARERWRHVETSAGPDSRAASTGRPGYFRTANGPDSGAG